MKKTLLIGLAAVALGSMTACSNILEEEGIVSPSAKTGTLTIALETDGSLDVATKSATSSVTLEEEEMGDFVITATKDGESSSSVLSYQNDAYYGVLPTGSYSVKARYDKMNDKVLAWNSPIFEGISSSNIIVEKGKEVTGSITASLKNSQIVLDTEAYQIFEELVTVSELYVYSGGSEPTNDNDKYSLILDANKDKTLYVKANQSDVKIVVKGNLASGGDPIEFTTNIKTKESDTTTEAKQYKVKYSLSTENGKMKITVNINGTITEEIIDAKVSPYGE